MTATTGTLKHQAWIRAQRFDDPAVTATFHHYLATPVKSKYSYQVQWPPGPTALRP